MPKRRGKAFDTTRPLNDSGFLTERIMRLGNNREAGVQLKNHPLIRSVSINYEGNLGEVNIASHKAYREMKLAIDAKEMQRTLEQKGYKTEKTPLGKSNYAVRITKGGKQIAVVNAPGELGQVNVYIEPKHAKPIIQILFARRLPVSRQLPKARK